MAPMRAPPPPSLRPAWVPGRPLWRRQGGELGEGGHSPDWRVPPKSPEVGRDSSGRRNVPLPSCLCNQLSKASNRCLHVYGLGAWPYICGKDATSAITSPAPISWYYPFECFRFLGNEELPYISLSREINILYSSLNFSREITKLPGNRGIPLVSVHVWNWWWKLSVHDQIAKVWNQCCSEVSIST
jgi:hypothetical protein